MPTNSNTTPSNDNTNPSSILTAEARQHIDEFIELSIGHLLDFADNEKELLPQIALFKEACKQDVAEAHDYYHIRVVLTAPTSILTGLDRYKYPISENDVKEFVIQHIEKNFMMAANKANVNLLHEGIDFDTIRKTFIKANEKGQQQFKSAPAAQASGYMPWEILEDAGERYQAELSFNEANTHAMLRYRLPLLHNSKYHFEIAFQAKPVFVSANEEELESFEDDFLMRLIPKAKLFIREHTTKTTLDDLYKHHVITLSEYELARNHWTGLAHILANHYYYDLIINKAVPLNFFILPPEIIARLTNKTTLAMVNLKLCTYMQASHLSFDYLQFCTMYLPYIKDRRLLVETILLMPIEKCQLLVKPIVCNLLKKNVLSLEQAINMPLHLNDFFSSSFYADHLARLADKLKGKALVRLQPEHCVFLLSSTGIQLISEGILAIEDVHTFNMDMINAHLHEKILSLLMNKIITSHDILRTTIQTLNTVINNAHIHDWLLQKIINLDDIQHKNLLNIAATALSRRLFAIYQHSARVFEGKRDTIVGVQQDTYDVCKTYQIPPQDLINLTLNKLIQTIYLQIQSPDSGISAEEMKAFIYIFDNFIPENSDISWDQALENLLSLTDVQIKKLVEKERLKLTDINTYSPKFWVTFFNQVTMKHANALQVFFDNLSMLREYLEPPKQHHGMTLRNS